MRRRAFLTAAGLGGVLGIAARAQQPGGAAAPPFCGAGCTPPPYAASHVDVEAAGHIEKATTVLERPLWSRMKDESRSEYWAQLKAAYQKMAGRNGTPGANGKPSPFSMAGQAWLHQYYCCPDMDPEGHIFPPGVRNIHATADFLPWHRAFVYFHERALQAHLGRKDFRLPVWDWEAQDGSVVPFIYEGMPMVSDENTPVTCRRRKSVPPITECMLQSWLNIGDFINPTQAGQDSPAPMSTHGPHSTVHTKLAGYMSNVPAAAFDPVFYAHHGNIDRFWEYWRSHAGPGHQALPQGPYYFFDAWPDPDKPKVVKVTPTDLLNTRELGYWYKPPNLDVLQLGEEIVSRQAGNSISLPLEFWRPVLRLLPDAHRSRIASILGEAAGVPEPAPRSVLKTLGVTIAAAAEFSVPEVEPGMVYALLVAGPDGKSPIAIARFGNFSSEGGPKRFSVPLCLTARKLVVLAQLSRQGGCTLFYGVIDIDDDEVDEPLKITPIDSKTAIFRFRLPQN